MTAVRNPAHRSIGFSFICLEARFAVSCADLRVIRWHLMALFVKEKQRNKLVGGDGVPSDESHSTVQVIRARACVHVRARTCECLYTVPHIKRHIPIDSDLSYVMKMYVLSVCACATKNKKKRKRNHINRFRYRT